jgi:hypothetical protein
MALSAKYGKIAVERGSIPEDEPVFLLRGKDKLVPRLLEYYEMMCKAQGANEGQQESVIRAAEEIRRWQGEHYDSVKLPDTDNGSHMIP